jgi:hypothetical protein
MAKLEDLLADLDDDALEDLLKKRASKKGKTRRVRVREFEVDVDDGVLSRIFGVDAGGDDDEVDEDDKDDGRKRWFERLA